MNVAHEIYASCEPLNEEELLALRPDVDTRHESLDWQIIHTINVVFGITGSGSIFAFYLSHGDLIDCRMYDERRRDFNSSIFYGNRNGHHMPRSDTDTI